MHRAKRGEQGCPTSLQPLPGYPHHAPTRSPEQDASICDHSDGPPVQRPEPGDERPARRDGRLWGEGEGEGIDRPPVQRPEPSNERPARQGWEGRLSEGGTSWFGVACKCVIPRPNSIPTQKGQCRASEVQDILREALCSLSVVALELLEDAPVQDPGRGGGGGQRVNGARMAGQGQVYANPPKSLPLYYMHTPGQQCARIVRCTWVQWGKVPQLCGRESGLSPALRLGGGVFP